MLNDESTDTEYKPVGGQGNTSSGQSGLGMTPPQLPPEVTQAGVVMDNEYRGWFKVYRKFDEWGWYHDSVMVHLFIHCLIKANYQRKEWKGIIIERGQFITSLDKLCYETGISRQMLRNRLSKLKSTHELTYETTHHFTLITVINYESYQEDKVIVNTGINTETNISSTHGQHTVNTNEEIKKQSSKELKNIKKKRKNIGEVFQLPADIDSETWNAFEEMRIAIKKPLTDRARKNIVISLDTIGQDKNEVLNQSITNCWRDVFKLRENNNGTGSAPQKKTKEKWEQILDGEITTW